MSHKKYKKKYKHRKGRWETEKRKLENKSKSGWRKYFSCREALFKKMVVIRELKVELAKPAVDSHIPQHIKDMLAKNLKDEECPICLEEIKKEDCLVTRCGHFFCMPCFAQHHEHKKECPICRTKITNY